VPCNETLYHDIYLVDFTLTFTLLVASSWLAVSYCS